MDVVHSTAMSIRKSKGTMLFVNLMGLIQQGNLSQMEIHD